MKTLHDLVAVKPIEVNNNTQTSGGGVKGFSGSDKTLRTLIFSEVLFDSKNFSKGQKLFFNAEVLAMPQVRKLMIHKDTEGNETEFILLSESLAVGAE